MNAINLTATLADYSCTHLQVECVSRAVVQSVIEVANNSERPLILRVLPDQVGSGLTRRGNIGFNGIKELVNYVRDRDAGGFVHFCRAGFAEEIEGGNSLSDAKLSINRDLDAGITFFHVDASKVLGKARGRKAQIELELELLQHISDQASVRELTPVFEVGGSEIAPKEGVVEDFIDYLDQILSECTSRGIETPAFAAAPTGTAIRELSNVALTERITSFGEDCEDTRLAEACDLASFRGVSLVAHGCDYMGYDYLESMFRSGVSIACLGPELGVYQTSMLLQFCDATRAASVRLDFLTAALNAGNWKKYLQPGSLASEQEKAMMAAHELFETEEFRSIKLRLEARCGGAGISLDQAIRDAQQCRLLTALRHLGSSFEVFARTL